MCLFSFLFCRTWYFLETKQVAEKCYRNQGGGWYWIAEWHLSIYLINDPWYQPTQPASQPTKVPSHSPWYGWTTILPKPYTSSTHNTLIRKYELNMAKFRKDLTKVCFFKSLLWEGGWPKRYVRGFLLGKECPDSKNSGGLKIAKSGDFETVNYILIWQFLVVL